MTNLDFAVARVTRKKIGRRPVVVTLAPAGAQEEALIGLRLLGKRTQYVLALSDVYRIAALWHGQKEAAARKAARKAGVPWKRAKRQFTRENSIPIIKRPTKKRKTNPELENFIADAVRNTKELNA